MARLRLPPVAVFAGASSLVVAVTFEALRGPPAEALGLPLMEKLEHPLWIVQAVNAAFGPLVAAMLRALGFDRRSSPTSFPTISSCRR